MPKITELLFDCDNTLVLSEELAFEACAELANEMLEKHGVSDRYTGEGLIEDFVGQNFRGIVTSLEKKYSLSMSDEEREGYVKKEEDKVIATLEKKAQPCIGVMQELSKLAEKRQYGLAVVSSSALRRVKASIKKVDQERYFPVDHIFSAATSLQKPTTKPDPAIYLHALKVIGKKADECVAIEDSKSGATSAYRAGIHVVGYVGSYNGEKKQNEMKQVLSDAGCKVIMTDWSEFTKCLDIIEKS
ncbi:MAG: hypothetical protein M1835_001370 [Candelina submexicana]|nr:MAG: hypothetical protein M1835_001370 [Candelina submexicana]